MGRISLLGRAASIGSQCATDGLLICPSTKLAVVQPTDRERDGGRGLMKEEKDVSQQSVNKDGRRPTE